EQDTLTKLLASQTKLPEFIRPHAENALQTSDKTDIVIVVENLRATQALIKACPSFYTDGFIKGVLDYAIHGGRIDEVCRFMDFLKSQIEEWIHTPPKNPEYAKQIVASIK